MRTITLLIIAIATWCLFGSADISADEKDREEQLRKREAILAAMEAGAEKSPEVVKAKASFAAIADRIAKAQRVEVYQLKPHLFEDGPPAKRSFLGYEISAEWTVDSAERRKEVAAFIGAALHWNELRKALCFSPRHGVRVVSGKETLGLVICFECFRVEVYEGSEFIKEYALTYQKDDQIEKLLPKAPEKAKGGR